MEKEKTQTAQQIDAMKKILEFKKAVAEGDIEERRKAEMELREAFEEIGLGEKLTEYLIAHIKRAVEIEKAYEEKCKLMQDVRETIRELARRV
jgi:alcohol dehydrogenase YqhD (iron-dependent ADH family)